jgi:uncharacterized membrane protein YbhN (UPF0104 family)
VSRRSLRAAAGTALRIAVSVGVLAVLLARFGVRDVLEVCLRARPLELLIAFAIYFASQLLSALRWQWLARGVGFEVGFLRCARFYLIGMFFMLAVPSTLGADAARALLLGRSPPGRAMALSTVAFDRLIGLVSLVGVAVVAILLHPDADLPSSVNWGIIIGGTAIVAGWLATPIGARRLPSESRIRRLVALDLAPYFRDHRLLLRAFALSSGVHALQIASQYALALSLGLVVSPLFVAVYHPLVALAASIPVTIGGFGLREAAYAYLLPRAGVAPDDAVALGLLWWAIGAVSAVVGGIVYALSGEKLRLKNLARSADVP